MNSESVDLIATDPPFNKGRDFHATPDSLAAGAKFQDRWSWERDVHPEWVDQLTDDCKPSHGGHRIGPLRPLRRNGRVHVLHGREIARKCAVYDAAHEEYLSPLRPYGHTTSRRLWMRFSDGNNSEMHNCVVLFGRGHTKRKIFQGNMTSFCAIARREIYFISLFCVHTLKEHNNVVAQKSKENTFEQGLQSRRNSSKRLVG